MFGQVGVAKSSPHYSRALLLQSRIRRCDTLGRMLHSAQAGGLAARSVNILFKDASLPRGLSPEACFAHSYKGASPLVESPRRGHTPFGTPRRSVTPPRGLSPEACFAHSYKGAQPPCKIPTKGAHPLRNSQAECDPASRLRAPVSLGDSTIS